MDLLGYLSGSVCLLAWLIVSFMLAKATDRLVITSYIVNSNTGENFERKTHDLVIGQDELSKKSFDPQHFQLPSPARRNSTNPF